MSQPLKYSLHNDLAKVSGRESCEGKLLEETAQQVDVSELDGDGFYTPKGVSGREDVV
jgi:hypothetical protein